MERPRDHCPWRFLRLSWVKSWLSWSSVDSNPTLRGILGQRAPATPTSVVPQVLCKASPSLLRLKSLWRSDFVWVKEEGAEAVIPLSQDE